MSNFLKSLKVKGIEIDTAGAVTGDVLKYNGTKFGAASAGGSAVAALNDLTDVVITSPAEFQGLSYDGTNWVNNYSPVVTYVRNAEATTITTGTCVYLFGATGDHASVKRADNNSDTTSSKTIGVVGANITASNNGPIVTRGYVDGIDLSVGYTAGDVLWLGEAGAFTKTKPAAPDHLVFIGVVVRANSNGIIYVATQNGYELDELHNVSLPSPASGDFLKYNGSLWVADAIDLGTDTTGNYMSGISGTSPVSVAHTAGEGSSATVSLAASYGDTQNPYASKTANYVLAAPNGTAGVPTFRSIVAADIPTLNQNTTGTAATVTGAAQTAITSVGTLTSLNVTGTATASTTITNELRTSNGNYLVINAGESSSYATGQTDEFLYVNAESGLQVNSSPDNWVSGWAGRKTATICATDGTSTFPGTVTAPTFVGALTGNASTATSAATLTTARNINGVSFNGSANIFIPRVISVDNRTAAPSSFTANYATTAFTSWNNNNTGPYADAIIFRTYSDASGGNDNMLALRKDALGLRLWQQAYGSATAFTTFKDIAWTDGTNATGTWAISTTGSAATVTGAAQTAITSVGTLTGLAVSTGNILLGATSARSVGGSYQNAVVNQIFNEQGSGGLTAFTSVLNRADSNGLRFVLGKSRGTAAGAVTALVSGDSIAELMFAGADGTTLDPLAARIIAQVDGTVATGSVPGRITFFTTSVGASVTAERMRITNAGNVGIGTASPSTALQVNGTITATSYNGALASTTTATTQTVGDNSTKVATTAFVIANAGGSFENDQNIIANQVFG
jgi:hypothetical protein